ncbi:MAG: response regulator [Bacteroidetes bacterium]|nr:response regulator [Bacteroidota bacterium]
MNKRKALIVDDDADLCYLINEVCRSHNYNTTIVNSLFEARSAIDLNMPSLIILDNSLPDGYGTDLIPYIETKPQNIEIILITGDHERPEAEFRAQGILYLLRKPFSLKNL